MSANLPKLVLHICCAPDEAYVIDLLRHEYELHCFFCNHNIHPKSEYDLRLSEAKRAAQMYGVAFSADSYEPALWKLAVSDFTDTPEGGARCRNCYQLRLQRTASFCKSIGWTSFSSVMSVSPHKRIAFINETGTLAAAQNNLTFVQFDFKKKDGFRKSIILSKELGLYRQDYCGCELSLAERDERNRQRSLQK